MGRNSRPVHQIAMLSNMLRVHPPRLLVSPYRIEPWLNAASRYVESLSSSPVKLLIPLFCSWLLRGFMLGSCVRHAGCTPWLQSTDIDSRHSAPRSLGPLHPQFLCFLLPRILMNIDEHIILLSDLSPSATPILLDSPPIFLPVPAGFLTPS